MVRQDALREARFNRFVIVFDADFAGMSLLPSEGDAIPDVVMDGLEMPEQLSRPRVERQDAGAAPRDQAAVLSPARSSNGILQPGHVRVAER